MNDVLPFDALLSPVDAGRQKRSESLTCRLTYLDIEAGKFRGLVDASKPEKPPYEVRLDAKDRTCRCTCVDFKRRASPCKHLAAFGRVCKTVANGISL